MSVFPLFRPDVDLGSEGAFLESSIDLLLLLLDDALDLMLLPDVDPLEEGGMAWDHVAPVRLQDGLEGALRVYFELVFLMLLEQLLV